MTNAEVARAWAHDTREGAIMTNAEVARAWAHDYSGNSGNMSTDGSSIYSYNHRIGYTYYGEKIAICCHYSATTAHHSNHVKHYATKVIECAEDYRKECRVYRASVVRTG
jgi:hypothetical protein